MPRQTAHSADTYKAEFIEIVDRAARRAKRQKSKVYAAELGSFSAKLQACQKERRCSSLACPECSRAIQLAKADGQVRLLNGMHKARSDKALVMGTLVPLRTKFNAGALQTLDVNKLHRWLKDNLKREGFDRPMIGNLEVSWEVGFWQPHWHLAMFTSNPAELTRRLKRIFRPESAYDRPVVNSRMNDLYFASYVHKSMKANDLLRSARRQIPELLLTLDKLDPFDPLFLVGIRRSAQGGSLIFTEIER